MAVTITDFVSGLNTPALLGNEIVKAEKVIDLSVKNSASGDTVQCLKIPAGAFVTRVGVLIITAEGGALTATVGDGVDPNGWDAQTDLNAAAGTMTQNDLDSGTDPYGEGRYYGSADTIDLVMSAAAGDTAKFLVWAEMRIMENQS